jgi:uncharacterized membrane protein HdeD (DUF308 family)
MAKTTAWLVTILGVWMVLGLLMPTTFLAASSTISMWAVALIVLVIGVTKLIRNYKKR